MSEFSAGIPGLEPCALVEYDANDPHARATAEVMVKRIQRGEA